MKSRGWRIPFTIGALASLYGFRMRAHLSESGKFVAAARVRRPFGKLLAQNWRNMPVVVGITVGGTSAFYTYTTYMRRCLKLSVGLGVGPPYALTAAVFGGSTDAAALACKDRGFEDGFFGYASALILLSLLVYL